MLTSTLGSGCGGGRAYDGSNRTVTCGRVGFGDACIERALQARTSRIRGCYEAELARAPTLAGELAVELTVEEDGETTGVHAADDTLGSAVVRDCVLGIIDELRFSPGSPGGPTTHAFPFVFEPRS